MNKIHLVIQDDTNAWVETITHADNLYSTINKLSKNVSAINAYTSKKQAEAHAKLLNDNGVFKELTA